MREIKFRFFDKKQNCFYDEPRSLNHFVFNYGNNYSDSGDCECDIIFAGQYTGLKDKNGKEIYEGDIIKVGENLVCEIMYVEENEEDYGDEIHSAFHAKIYNNNKIIPLDGYIKSNCVLIGNIFENPELNAR